MPCVRLQSVGMSGCHIGINTWSSGLCSPRLTGTLASALGALPASRIPCMGRPPPSHVNFYRPYWHSIWGGGVGSPKSRPPLKCGPGERSIAHLGHRRRGEGATRRGRQMAPSARGHPLFHRLGRSRVTGDGGTWSINAGVDANADVVSRWGSTTSELPRPDSLSLEGPLPQGNATDTKV